MERGNNADGFVRSVHTLGREQPDTTRSTSVSVTMDCALPSAATTYTRCRRCTACGRGAFVEAQIIIFSSIFENNSSHCTCCDYSIPSLFSLNIQQLLTKTRNAAGNRGTRALVFPMFLFVYVSRFSPGRTHHAADQGGKGGRGLNGVQAGIREHLVLDQLTNRLRRAEEKRKYKQKHQ